MLVPKEWFADVTDDKRYPLTDCISFALMKREGIAMALTLDHHFAQAGFFHEPAGSP